ncbi:MAG: carboxypeptidase-like regulatory domain-containing protein [Bacteroidota bacterium]
MRNELKHIEEIENYLTGNMNAEQRLSFESKMKADDNLAQDVVLQQQIMERLKLNAFKNEMIAFHSGLASSGKSTWWSKGIYLNSFLALLVLGITFSATYYFGFFDNTNNEEKTPSTETQKPLVSQHTSFTSSTPLPQDQKENESKPEEEANPVAKKTIPVKKSLPAGFVSSPGETKVPQHHFLMVYETETMDAEQGITFQTNDSKSFVHIPANIIVDKDGFPVKGKVKIMYREYRNAAQTAFSGIPMVYYEKGQEYNFNSAGMFEIRAFRGKDELKIKQGASFTVDYNVTEKLDSCYFFALNDKTNKWEKRENLEFKNQNNVNDPQVTVTHGWVRKRWIKGKMVTDTIIDKVSNKVYVGMLKGQVSDAATGKEMDGVKMNLFRGEGNSRDAKVDYTTIPVDTGYVIEQIEPGIYSAEITCSGYYKIRVEKINISENTVTKLDVKMKARKKRKEELPLSKRVRMMFMKKEKRGLDSFESNYTVDEDFSKIVEVKETEIKRIVTREEGGMWENDTMMNGGAPVNVTVDFEGGITTNSSIRKDNGNRTTGAMIPGSDPGHSYPNLVRGLQCETFGVFNCDQIYRVPDQLMVKASYVNEKGKKIEEGHILSMIDLKFNGAFSFDPSYFTCSKSGRNVLLLFTNDKKLYALTEEEYKKMNISKSGEYTFAMQDITKKVKDPDDLKNFLGLK